MAATSFDLWVAVGPDGAIHLPDSPESLRFRGKKAAIVEARSWHTLDVELREHCDFGWLLSWDEAKAAGYKVRLATVALKRGI